jgi:hypothetical protein
MNGIIKGRENLPYANWNSDDRNMNFNDNRPDDTNDNLAPRPSVRRIKYCAAISTNRQAFCLLLRASTELERFLFHSQFSTPEKAVISGL